MVMSGYQNAGRSQYRLIINPSKRGTVQILGKPPNKSKFYLERNYEHIEVEESLL